MSNDNKESQFYLVGHKLINVIYINNNFDNGIFHGIDTYDHLETRANTGLLPLVYNRVGVGATYNKAQCQRRRLCRLCANHNYSQIPCTYRAVPDITLAASRLARVSMYR